MTRINADEEGSFANTESAENAIEKSFSCRFAKCFADRVGSDKEVHRHNRLAVKTQLTTDDTDLRG